MRISDWSSDVCSYDLVCQADQTSAELQITGTYERWDFITGLYYFHEDGFARQDNTVFTGFPGNDLLTQDTDSKAIYTNVGFHVTEQLRLSAGLRYTEDDKKAGFNINDSLKIGRAHVCTPVTNAQLVCRLLLENKKKT